MSFSEEIHILRHENYKTISRWWFQILFIFIPIWGNYPTLLISNGLKPSTRYFGGTHFVKPLVIPKRH